ncbi:MAG: magnesium transporter [Candidatus Micrarchaeota archaeon]
MKPVAAQAGREYHAYPKIGRLMVTNIPAIRQDATVGDAERLLLKRTNEFETINYLYVLDERERLVGVMSIKDIFRMPKSTPLRNVMTRKLVIARPHTHQERVAYLAIEHNLKAIPVVDHEDRLLGVVPSDVILKILHDEHLDDILHAAGIHRFKDPSKELIHAPVGMHYRKRIPWLVLGLIGGVLAAFVVGSFEHALQNMLVLASFIPAIVYIADAVGTQTEMLLVRSMAISQDLDLRQYVFRELAVALLIGLTLGAIIGLLSFAWWQSQLLSAILALAVFIAILSAVASAIFLPLALRHFRIDPALGAGPFATVITDILSLVIYFTVASLAIGYLA